MPRPRLRLRRPARAIGLAACLLALAVVGCGKKGPPLAPFSKVPGAPQEVKIRRKGDRVEAQFKVPEANSDGRRPAKIDSVAVFALTSPAKGMTTPLFRKYADPVADAVVREPPPPPPDVKEGQPPPPPPPPRTDPGLDQGQPVVLSEVLTPEALVPVPIKEIEKAKKLAEEALKKHPPVEPPLTPPDLGPPLEEPPVRFYAVGGLNGNDKGSFSSLTVVSLESPPPAPAAPEVSVAEGRIDVAWTAPDGLRRPVMPSTLPPLGTAASATSAVPGAPAAPPPGAQAGEAEPDEDAAAPPEVAPEAQAEQAPPEPSAQPPAVAAPPAVQVPVPGQPAPGAEGTPAEATEPNGLLPARLLSPFPTPTYTYVVYETAPPDFKPPTLQPGFVPPYPTLLTTTGLTATKWSDSRFEVGKVRCYAVATVSTTGTSIVESAMSPAACATTKDVFAPAAPKGLAAVASVGAISLIWDANAEADLAGYIVLRGPAGGPLTPLTKTPIRETTYRDATVKRGVRYAYAIVAVDTAKPPNMSAQSTTVEETGR